MKPSARPVAGAGRGFATHSYWRRSRYRRCCCSQRPYYCAAFGRHVRIPADARDWNSPGAWCTEARYDPIDGSAGTTAHDGGHMLWACGCCGCDADRTIAAFRRECYRPTGSVANRRCAHELDGLDLGDARRNYRAKLLLAARWDNPSASFSTGFSDWKIGMLPGRRRAEGGGSAGVPLGRAAGPAHSVIRMS